MLLNFVLRAFSAGLLLSGAQSSPIEHQKRQGSIEEFIKKQADVSIKGVLANIGPDGSNVQGLSAGIMVASPSRTDPDYWFTWTRDSALTYKVLIERLIAGDSSLKQKIDEYISASAELQNVSNLSGDASSAGLGEPKFNVDKTAFNGPWGRPQRDGPPLRATALIIYSNWLIANGGSDQAANTVWPVIAKDLAYTVRYWNQTGFDLWEETMGSSFFTLSASYRALIEGAALAGKISKTCEGCSDAAPQVLCFMQNFWNGQHIVSNINLNTARTGKDVNSIISSIHTFDPESECTDATFQPCSSRALLNHKVVTDSFRSAYTINKGIPQGKAVAVGRYTEDVYYNGNPWYLATTAAAEQLYAALYQWEKHGSVTVDSVSLPFFKDLMSNVATGSFAKGSDTYIAITSAVRTYADGYIAVVQKYTPADGALAEQFDRNTGTPLSAVDLTWSYAAFLTATDRRSNIVGPSWGESTNNSPPTICTAPPSCTASVTFSIRATTTPGENVFIVGQLSELGSWDPANAKPLKADKYTAADPVWTAQIELPADTVFEYKYVRKMETGGEVVWERNPNNQVKTGRECGGTQVVEDTWRAKVNPED